MEPAKIDWNRIESRFEEDLVYEHINAPKWVDFLNPLHSPAHDVASAWFCRPDCNHPKSVEEFLNKTPTVPTSPAAYSTLRDPNLKRRGQQGGVQHKEDLDPKISFSTPPPSNPTMPAAFKSHSEKRRKPRDDNGVLLPRLRTTMSARNLFAGKDIVNHITEFCNELKKLATRAKQKESNEEENMKIKRKNREDSGAVLRNSSRVENVKVGENQSQKKLSEEAENVPPSLNLENLRRKGGEQFFQIRTNPPSPQCFSGSGSIKTTTPPPKASQQSRLAERGVLQELKPIKEVKNGKAETSTAAAGREAGGGALDMFWFLKPCTVSD